MVNVSSVIIQTHGQQKVVLMPPISEQYPHHHWLDFTGQFLFNKEIDLSASESVLSYESRLAYATLYSVHLNPGDILLVPANWFIYRKSISPSISMSLNCISGATWPLFCSQAERMKQKQENEYLTQEKYAVTKWANRETRQYPHNERNILSACEKIQTAIGDTTQPVLDLSCLKLSSLPDTIFRISHLKTLDFSNNKLTSWSLNRMKNLVSLNLAYNQLTSVSLNRVKDLASLNLEHNKLTSFSLNHAKNLVLLNLEHNKLIYFSLHHAKNLVSLNLEHNKLTSFSLNFMKNLALLNLAFNEFTSFSLSDKEKLGSLNLSYNRLTDFSLSHMENLVSLNLAHNQLIAFSLKQAKKLGSLDLSYNQLPDFSFKNAKNLKLLNLSHNSLISCSLGSAEKLGSLDLSYNQLPDFSLSHMQNLVLLNLSYNTLNSFLSCDLPNVIYIDLCHNHLSHLGPNCISSINTHQRITLDLRNNPLSNEGRTQIQNNLLQRSGGNITYYPILHPLIEYINHNTMTYKDFIALLFHNNISPSKNDCLICPITHTNPSQVIVLMSRNKCYKIYDADALIKWIRTQSQSEELSEEIQNPYTREPLTLEHLISAKELCVLQYLKQELGPVFTENIDMIHDHKS